MPKEQISEKTPELLRAITLPAAIEKGTQLSFALRDKRLEFGTKWQIAEMINIVSDYFGAQETMSKAAKKDLLNNIIAEFPNLNVEEIALALKYGREGKYNPGKQFHKLNAFEIMRWIREYASCEEKCGYWERANNAGGDSYIEERDAKGKVIGRSRVGSGAMEPDNILGDVFGLLANSIPTPGLESLVALGAQEPVAPLTRAQQLRAEADRLEQEEQERERNRVADIEARKHGAAIVLDGLQLEADWKEYAKEHYYSKLTKEEKEVIKASETRILFPAEQPIFAGLCDRYEAVVSAWENRPLFPIPDVEE